MDVFHHLSFQYLVVAMGPTAKVVLCRTYTEVNGYTGLRKLVAENKGNVIDGSKGLGGRGELSKRLMDTIQNYYGLAIRRNKDLQEVGLNDCDQAHSAL